MANLWQQLNDDLSLVVEMARRSLVKVNNGHNGAGAGVVIHANGLILTNAHVVRYDTIEVTLPDERKMRAKIRAYDPDLDLAALSVAAENLPTIELGDSKNLQPGHLVLAMGHPWGVTGCVSAGPVINVGVPPEMSRMRYEFIQTGLQLRPGHSGGPLVDTQGRLVGINTAITGPKVGLAIPIHIARDFLRDQLGSRPSREETYI